MVSDRLMLLITLTNWAWIPFILYYDLRLRSYIKSSAGTGSSAPSSPPSLDTGRIGDSIGRALSV